MIINKNQKADWAIKSVCLTFEPKFKLKGFSIEYRTQFTQFCKPKHAIPSRAIVFPPAPGFQESQTVDDGNGFTDDGGLIDRKFPLPNSQNIQKNDDGNGLNNNNNLLDPKLWN